MGFQHMTKAARRRIQSLGGKAMRRKAKRDRRLKETVTVSPWSSATTAGTFGSVSRITIEGNGPDQTQNNDALAKVLVTRIQQAERERIKAAILKVIG